MPYHTIPTTAPLADLRDSRQPTRTGPNATTGWTRTAAVRGKIFGAAA